MHFLIASAALSTSASPRESRANNMQELRNRWEFARQQAQQADKRGRLTNDLVQAVAAARELYQAARVEWEAELDDSRAATPGAALEEAIRATAVQLEIVQATIAEKGESATRSKQRETLTRKLGNLISTRPTPAESADENGIESADESADPTPAGNLRSSLAELSRE